MIKPPFSVTMLTIIVLTSTIWNALRLYQTLHYWKILIDYHSQPGPIYMLIISLVWVVIGLALIIGFIYRYSRSLLIMKLATILFTTWYLVDRLFIQKPQTTHLYPMVTTVFVLLFVSILINQRQTKIYFKLREAHDR
jgi:hypothetical protein